MTDQIEPFRAIEISLLAHELKAQGIDVIHMEFGQPSTGAPAAAIAAAHRVLDADGMGYWESPALKARLSRHYAEQYGVEVAPQRFVFTCGASPALVLALISSFSAGDRVALARPGYVAYRNNLKALNLRPVEIACGPAERFQLTAEAVARLDPAPAGLIVASPANPTGTIIARDELRAITELCRARRIKVISDEIYHGLSFAEPAASMLEFSPDATVVNSFSKYYSMVGWRLGWVLSPQAEIERVRAYMGNMFLTAPSLSQHAGLAAMDCREELDGHLEVYRHNRDLLLGTLPSLGLSSIAPPDGAFYIYVDVGHLTDDSLAFCKRLLRETGVATSPGLDFDPVDGRRFMRFSFAVATRQVEAALERLRPWFAVRTSSMEAANPSAKPAGGQATMPAQAPPA